MNAFIYHPLINVLLFITIIGEFAVPRILKCFYKEYNSKTMVMSVLGSPESPVRTIYNAWLVWLGSFLLLIACLLFAEIKKISTALAILFFVFFILGDKEHLKETVFSYEGLWERMCLFFMYVPFLYDAIINLLSIESYIQPNAAPTVFLSEFYFYKNPSFENLLFLSKIFTNLLTKASYRCSINIYTTPVGGLS